LQANTKRLAALTSAVFTYKSDDHPGLDKLNEPLPPEIVNNALKRMVALPDISLKVSRYIPGNYLRVSYRPS
jgi:hypothetical protein